MSDQTCACPDCNCAVSGDAAYCSESCAGGHQDGKGCGHGCGCAG